MTRRIGRGGRTGESHTATPQLRSYDVPPASPVTVTRADGTQTVQPAKAPKATRRPSRQSRKTGPLICGWCGGPIKGPAARGTDYASKGKPVHQPGDCDTTPPKQPTVLPPASRIPRTTGGTGNPYASANAQAVPREEWIRVTCPKCKAGPGQRCTGTRATEGALPATAHLERVRVVRAARERERLQRDAEIRARQRPSGRQPRMKDMYKIECPSCRAAPGTDCTIKEGHSVRYNRMMELFRAGEFKLT